ncbi:MAG: hypothetical protein JKY96_03435 [Phycisphaerales bacterium]|nr:hypothetical protein [Phycisphaerales bacterium]
MPASRSRTERWKESLWRIYERGGGLEFTIDHGDSNNETHKDLIWRVRVLNISETEIIVEQPGSMGMPFQINDETPLIGIISVGQNKWMFHTKVLGHTSIRSRNGDSPALRIEMPRKVERCLRRDFDRISTAKISMPKVDCWKLLDPHSAVPFEVANQSLVADLLDSGQTAESFNDQATLPEVGPMFQAMLSNVGGGGVGLIVDKENRASIDAGQVFWLRMDLRPTVPTPLVLTARLAHTHIDSQQNTYAGLAFDFGLNPEHKGFVVGQIARYIMSMQAVNKKAA